jgi:EmrB/QacA subfamily drug resistance transporter
LSTVGSGSRAGLLNLLQRDPEQRGQEQMTEAQARHRWFVLAVVGAAFFMTILDVAIVTVAIPSIQKDLHIAESTVQWTLTAYAITFGGFLLLGGRVSDLLGRRIVFVGGLVLFTGASLACGLANTASVLIAARAIQGIGAAIISPAALSIVTTTFTEGADRNKALGIWGALGGSGAAVGVLLGGILTKYLGWEWIFFVNVPVGVLVLLLTRPIVPESRADLGHRRFDVPGAVAVTSGLALLVYAISKAPEVGWGTGRTIGLLIASIVVLAAFVVWEERITAPLVPFSVFRIRTLTASNIVGLLLGGVIYANFFILTLYVQGILGWSALKTGLTFLATAGTAVIWAGVAQALVTRIGPRPVMTVGLVILGLSVLGYTRLPVDGHYWPDLLPLYLTFSVGMVFGFVPVTIAAFIGVPHELAGLASGLMNTTQQIGGAIGVAVASTIFTSKAKSGHFSPAAFTSGYHWAFAALVAFAAAGAVAAFVLLRGVRAPEAETEPARAMAL